MKTCPPRESRPTVLLGGTSQLGYAIVRSRARSGLVSFCSEHSRYETCNDWPRVNLEDAESLRRLVRDWTPRVVLHCAGICDVEKCESQPEFAWQVNFESIRVLLDCLPRETRLVYVSSDHVFGGGRGPYREGDDPHPVSVYGKTRVAAEREILGSRPEALVIRHGLGIGPSVGGRSGHLDWLRYRTRRGLPTTVIADEVRSVVWSDELAERVWALAHSGIRGIRHVTATTAAARPALAESLSSRFGIGARLRVASRAQQPAPHIGDVRLGTRYSDPLASPLRRVI